MYESAVIAADMSAAITADQYMNPGVDQNPPSGAAPA